MFKVLSLILLSLLTVTAQAEELPLPEGVKVICDFSGRVELTDHASIICLEENATVAPGTQIITNGFDLDLTLLGNIDFSDLQIVSFDQESLSSNVDAGLVSIKARSVKGALMVNNMGRSNEDLSGTIHVGFVTLDCDFSQSLETGAESTIERWLNNQEFEEEFPEDRCTSANE